MSTPLVKKFKTGERESDPSMTNRNRSLPYGAKLKIPSSFSLRVVFLDQTPSLQESTVELQQYDSEATKDKKQEVKKRDMVTPIVTRVDVTKTKEEEGEKEEQSESGEFLDMISIAFTQAFDYIEKNYNKR